MNTWTKDILSATFMGLILPGILLNFGELLLENKAAAQLPEISQTHPAAASIQMQMRTGEDAVLLRDMEDYLVEVLLAEVPASFEEEALKAQAVAARTYTRKAWETGGKHGDGSVCTDPGCCQAWISREAYLSGGGTREGIRRMERAVQETSGEVLQYQGELIEATYFSCSGGSTEEASAVWGSDIPYLQAVLSPGEEEAAHYTDTVVFTPQQFRQRLDARLEGPTDGWFGKITYTDGGGVETVIIGGEVWSGTQLRRLLGLNSTKFKIAVEENIVITTLGYGHRVGMSQYGADAMAVAGYDYLRILDHYYPGTNLVTLN